MTTTIIHSGSQAAPCWLARFKAWIATAKPRRAFRPPRSPSQTAMPVVFPGAAIMFTYFNDATD